VWYVYSLFKKSLSQAQDQIPHWPGWLLSSKWKPELIICFAPEIAAPNLQIGLE